jgi:hypothetical protein
MKLLDEYYALREKIYEYFGYEESWQVFPIMDHRRFFWLLLDHKIVFCEEKISEENEDKQYSALFYSHISEKHHKIYQTENYTMICIDTQCDGNIFLAIFDNSKEQLQDDIDEEYFESL